MIRLALLLAVPPLLPAQHATPARGADLFRKTCAVAYCHGPQGGPGRAPQLAGKSFTAVRLTGIIRKGIPNTAMPGFDQQLPAEDIEELVHYVLSLSGPAGEPDSGEGDQRPKLPPGIEKGRALFFDAVRMGGCGTCHEVAERGAPVGPTLKKLPPEKLRSLRAGSSALQVTVHPADEEPFPAVLQYKTAERVRAYDLTARLPVLRTLPAASVKLTPGSSWSHAQATKMYTDAELEVIAGYLSWVANAPPDRRRAW